MRKWEEVVIRVDELVVAWEWRWYVQLPLLMTSHTYAWAVFVPGTHDIHALILGRAITGLQAFTADK